MAVNYASKFSPMLDERFALGSLTEALINHNYDWVGVETVKVFSNKLVTPGNYSITGSNRYGSPAELENDVQELQMIKDRAFTYTIDKKSEQDTMGTLTAVKTLAENINLVMIPEIDKYRILILAANVPTSGTHSSQSHIVTATVTKANAYEEFLKVQERLDNDYAPQGGRICICTPAFHNFLKLDANFTKTGDMATRIAINGQVGEVDGVPIVKVPTNYFPANVDFIITNPMVTPAPVKLQEFKIHEDAPGISGALVECRMRYDAFVLNNKKDALGMHTSVAPTTEAPIAVDPHNS